MDRLGDQAILEGVVGIGSVLHAKRESAVSQEAARGHTSVETAGVHAVCIPTREGEFLALIICLLDLTEVPVWLGQ